MAYEGPQPLKLTGLVAAADLSALQYTFVKLDANGDVVAASAQGEDCIGVLQNNPDVGGACEIVALGVTKASADSAINEMDQLTTAADGQADQAASGDYVLGKALTAASNADEIITIMVDCISTPILA